MRTIKIGLLCLLLSASQWLHGQTPLKLIVTDPSFTSFTAGDITAFKNTIVSRSFLIRNTSNTTFTGRVLLKDVFGSSLSVEDITITYEDGTLPKGTAGSPIDANWMGLSKTLNNPISGTDYYIDITNLPSSIGKNAGLIITRRVKIIDCIDDNSKGKSEVYLSVCDGSGSNCQNMTDAWENTNTRLIQRISKKNSEFVDIVDYEFRNGGYCSYNSSTNNTDGFRTISLVAKMHNATDGESIERFGFQLSASDKAEIPNSRVKIYKAIKNGSGKYVPTGAALNISPTVELNPVYHYIPVFLANPRCSPDAIQYAFYEIGTMSGADAYYIEFDVLNCQYPIDVKNLNTNVNQDDWAVYWRGLDNCNTILSNAPNMPQSCGVSVDDQDIRPTSVLSAGAISGANYGDYVYNKFTYTERVSSLFANTVGNNRLSNTFVSNSYSFLGTCYSDGFNYQVDRGKIVVALKMEAGLNYYTGPTTGGYFDRMHFRNPDGKQWTPTSQLGSPTALYNIPTDESPLKAYDEIHFFEFDLTTLYALYPAAQTATSNQKRSLLYQYLNASDLVYAMQADCGAPNQKDLVNYTVEMYFVLDGSCSNPFVFPSSKITRDAKIMCPGCMFPGGAGAGVSIQRSTFGYRDANDNHVPDNPATLLTEAQVLAINGDNDPDNNIRTSFGIVGDHVKMKTEYYLTGSEGCNGNTWDDMMIGPLTYSYLYINFPKDTIAIDTSIPVKFKIKSGGNVYSFTAPVSAIVDLGNGPTQHIFALNTSILNTYLDAGSPSLPNGFRFHSFDKVEYEFELNVLLNSNTTESYQEVFFTHSPYFSSVPLSQRTGDFPQFSCDPINGPSWKDANGNVNLVDLPPPYASNHPYSTTFLLCEGYETIFNLVPVIQQVRYDGTGGGATAETNPNCVKERDYGIVSSIGLLDEKRLFLNEVREAPYLNEIDVIIPSGYRLLEFNKSTAMYSDDLPWYSRNEDRTYNNLTPTSSQTFVVGGETFTKEHYVFPSPILKNDDDVITYDPTKIGELRVFDEKSYQQVNVYFEAICSEIENKPDLIADQSTTNQNVMNKIYFDHDNISPFDEFLMNKSVNFLKPSNGLTSTISTTGIVGAVSSSFNVNFAINQSSSNTKTPARYPFISIEYTPSDFSNFNLTTTSGYPVTLVESTTLGNGNVKALYSITINPNNRATTRFSMSQNQSIPFNISGQLEKCFDNPNSPASFKVGYGWDCNGFPTSVADLASKCFIQEEEIKVYSIQSGLQSELTAASLGDRCLNPKIKYTHRLVSTGSQVNQVSYTIDLPDGLTLATGSIDIQYGSTSIAASDYTITNISTPTNQGVYELVLSPTALTAIPFAGAVVQGNRQEELILTFNARVASGCNVYLATSLSKIDVTATNFCSSTLQNHSEVIPDYEACDNTYTVSIQGEQLYCANANIASPITLTAVIPPLSPTVCYTLPITYEWKILGTSTIISTSDMLNTTITQATTFEVTTTDAAGRKATASYTVDYDVEYQIGSISYVCGDPNRSICVPIDAKRVVRNGIIGMDFCLKYDKRFVSPNTVVNNSNLGTVVTSGGAFQATYFMTSNTFPVVEPDPNIGYVHVSIYYTSVSSSNSAQFVGSGRVMCVPFTVLGNPPVGQGFTFEMCEMYESYTLEERRVCWGPGQFNVTYSPNMKGQLTYYQLNQVALAQQTVGFPYFVTNTIKTSAGCVDPTIGTFTTDNNGGFNFNIGTANTFSIERDIHNYFTTPYSWYFRQFVNAVDTRAMEFITTMNATSVFSGTSTFKPSAGQMIAADVNMSDSIRSNDITLTQRMIGLIGEYPQVQNRVSKPSLDWRFIEDAYYSTLPDFTRSVQYPFYDGSTHYWRDNVPNVPNCFAIQQQCYSSPTPLYRGILLGDLINSSSAYYTNPYIRTSEKQAYHYEVNIDNAIAVSDREYLIPVYYQTADTTTAYAFDFDLAYQTDSLMITGLSMDSKIEEKQPRLAWTDMADDGSLRSTNYTMDFWSKSGTVYYISVVRFNNNPLTANDFKEGYGLINGVKSEVYISGNKTASTTNTQNSDLESGWLAQVVPNPANDQGKIVFRFTDAHKDNAIRILDVIGHEISNYSKLPQEGSILLSDLAAGMYIAHVYDKSTGTSRVIKFIKK